MNSAEDQVEESNVNEEDAKIEESSTDENLNEELNKDENPEADSKENFESKCKELEDQMLRLRAEQENFRRAQFKETEKKVNIAIKNVVTKFLSVIGALDQGIQSAEQAKDIEGVVGGMKLVGQSFKSTLTEIGVDEVPTEIGQPFDPNFHQPLTRVESDEHPENSILNIISKGYTLKGMLVQPSMVTVSCEPKPEEVKATDEPSEEGEDNSTETSDESGTD